MADAAIARTGRPLRFVVLCPHFAPDIAPTGRVMTQLVEQWAALGHEIHVVTSLPWYRSHRVETGWSGRLIRRETTTWGSVTRVHPLTSANKSNLVARAVAFVVFSLMAGFCAVTITRKRIDAVIAMSPPLTLGTVGWLAARVRRTRLVFNVQDIFPDAVVRTGAITNRFVISLASWLERFTYRRSHAVVVLSDDLRDNVRAKLVVSRASTVHVVPNFVDTVGITPRDRLTPYRTELGLGAEPVVMYAGNVGYSQGLEALVEVARRNSNISFVVNGDGAALADLRAQAAGLANVRFSGYQPDDRLAEVLATADVQVVSLRAGLAAVSVPSKVYSILAAGRGVVAVVDRESEIDRLITSAGAGIVVAPGDIDAFDAAIRTLALDPTRRHACGVAGRAFIERHPSARDAALAYANIVADSMKRS